MFTFLLVLQFIVTLALITVILMQKSEGGGLGIGGSPAGFLSARGAADFLSRATAVLAVGFVSLSIALAVVASLDNSGSRVDTNATTAAAPAPAAPLVPSGGLVPLAGGGAIGTADPLAAAAGAIGTAAPATAPVEKGVPLQQ